MLKNNYKFNWYIIVDIIYFNKKPVLYIINKVTAFQATKFLRDINKECLKYIINLLNYIYQGPPNTIIANIGKNFTLKEFRQYILTMDIKIKEVLIKAYNSIRKVKQYYTPL